MSEKIPKNVLCVQRDKEIQRHISHYFILTDLMIFFLHTSDAREAMEYVRHDVNRFVAVITSYHLPPIGGAAFALNLRRMGYVNPIVGFSAYADLFFKDDALRSGMNKYVCEHDVVDLVEVFKELNIVSKNPFKDSLSRSTSIG